MIDLHIHSTNSDGTDTVEEILKKAENLKLDYISITDHDTCKGYDILKNIDAKKIYSGKIIPGIELKCSYKGRIIEVIGMDIDTDKMNNWLSNFYKGKTKADLQTKYFNFLYEKAESIGLMLTKKEDIVWNPEVDWASVTIYKDFKKYPQNEAKLPEDLWKEFSYFTRKYCADPNNIFHIDKTKDYPSLEQAIDGIKFSNGYAIMPHIFIYKWVLEEDKKDFVEELIKKYDIDGFECYYPDFSEEQKKYIIDVCNRNGLYKSGGSDCHGKNKPERYKLRRSKCTK